MSRAYTATIGVSKKQLYTFNFDNNYHIIVADVGTIDIPAVKEALAGSANTLIVGPIQFNLHNCSANFKGTALGPTTWIASEYADTIFMNGLPAQRDEIVYLVESLLHLLEQ